LLGEIGKVSVSFYGKLPRWKKEGKAAERRGQVVSHRRWRHRQERPAALVVACWAGPLARWRRRKEQASRPSQPRKREEGLGYCRPKARERKEYIYFFPFQIFQSLLRQF
jgi:hypothetical protein